MKKIANYIIAAFTAICFVACDDVWEDHVRVSDEAVEGSVFERIQSDANLSKFTELLVATGYDKDLKSGMVHTVWAPSNTAFESFDNAILNDSVELKKLIANHIVLGTHLAQSVDTVTGMTSLNGKQLYWVPKEATIEGTAITESNILCKNGVLHNIGQVLVPKQNIWEILNSDDIKSRAPGNVNFLVNYNYLKFDEENSTKIGVDSLGRNVYDSVKYYVSYFLQDVGDVHDESKYFTFFLLTDKGLVEQFIVYRDYFKVDATSKSDSVAWLNISKDYLFEEKFSTLPDTLINPMGVKVPVIQNEIIESIEASNGVIYVYNTSKIALKDKVRTVLIEGESEERRLLSNSNFNQYTVYKETVDANASGYKYIFLNNFHNYVNNYFEYETPLFSCQYKAYWVAYYVPGGNENLNQVLSVVLSNSETTVGTVAQTPEFTEVFLGNYTSQKFGEALLRAKCANGVANQLSLDYIKLVPVLP